ADVAHVPLKERKWVEIDTRESPDHMALGVPLFLDTLTEYGCVRAGLPPNPNNEGRTWIEPERIRERLSWRGEDHVELQQDLQASVALQKRREAWNGLRNSFLDSYKSQTLRKLVGRRLSRFWQAASP